MAMHPSHNRVVQPSLLVDRVENGGYTIAHHDNRDMGRFSTPSAAYSSLPEMLDGLRTALEAREAEFDAEGDSEGGGQ